MTDVGLFAPWRSFPHGRSAPLRSSALRGATGPWATINGRFLSQPVTGVQRYAREILKALDPLLAARGGAMVVALPRTASLPRGFDSLRAGPRSRWSGHLWEQAILPFAGSVPLLNLCNTGPVSRRRQIICIHDTNVFTEPASYRRGLRSFYKLLQPLLAKRALAVATVSNAAAADLARIFGLDRRSIAVLPNGHEHALRWTPAAGDAERVPTRRPFVLLLGSRARHKNATLILQLAPVLDARGLDIVVVGGDSAIFADEGLGRVASPNIQRVGAVDDGLLGLLMDRALCLVFPSWTEGFGLPVVEAMAHGCPVVSSDRASLPEVCGGAALLAAPDDPAAWLDAIGALQHSSDLRADLAGRGRERAQRFSWAASARGYLDLLETIA